MLPLILTGPKEAPTASVYWTSLSPHTLGESARRHYRIIIDDPAEVARQMKKAMPLVKSRRETDDAYSFNWSIRISPDLQMPFDPTHEIWPTSNSPRISRWKCWPTTCVVPSPGLSRERQRGGHQAIEQYGRHKLHGDPEMMRRMDDLLQGFVAQHRMKLPGGRLYSLLRNHRLISPLPPGHRLTPAPAALFL